MRFGELRAIRYSDIQNGVVTISRSASDVNPAYLDDNGHVAFSKTTTEITCPKGATEESIRDFPLTPEAVSIIELLHKESPKNQFVFMSNGGPLKNVTFNRHLKAACEKNGIQYRSSHVIRFSNCDELCAEGDVSLTSLQNFMGHSSASMTAHYIDKHKPKGKDNLKVISKLSIA